MHLRLEASSMIKIPHAPMILNMRTCSVISGVSRARTTRCIQQKQQQRFAVYVCSLKNSLVRATTPPYRFGSPGVAQRKAYITSSTTTQSCKPANTTPPRVVHTSDAETGFQVYGANNRESVAVTWPHAAGAKVGYSQSYPPPIPQESQGDEPHSGGTVAGSSTRDRPLKNSGGGTGSPVSIMTSETLPSEGHACIALGSNLGDKIGNIEAACRLIDSDPDMQILETSSLYETKPMYVEDQDSFVNGVCIIQSRISPLKLLNRLQNIEKTLGRVKLIDKGPRSIDLDIVSFGQCVFQSDRLTIPHASLPEREFVLCPMIDTSDRQWRHPQLGSSIQTLYNNLPRSEPALEALTAVGSNGQYLRRYCSKRCTSVMSIINVTPDSFSDGGIHKPIDVDSLISTIKTHIENGATILDVGGQSSRPNAADVTAEEEIERILPVIRAIKALPEAEGIAISVDTYRARVAEAAVEAGAHIINDISAGLLDPEMLPTVARLGCTYIMMHMRGTPATMQNDENTAYPEGLCLTICNELKQRLDAAQAAGIRRWRIILDPGIGFAKTPQQNLVILQSRLTELAGIQLRGMTWLLGASRKSFIGEITGAKDPNDRVGGTAATVVASIQAGASIVRVHDVKIMAQVAKMADAIYSL